MQDELQKQYSKNCLAYISIYAVIGIMSGLIFDALITYLLAVAPDTAKSMASYMGAATFAASFTAVLAPRLGFKRIITFAAAVITASLLLISHTQIKWLIGMGIFLMITGTSLFDVMLSPFIAAYTTKEDRSAAFTKASFASVLGIILGTSMGGPLIVWIYSGKLHISYQQAMALTKSLDSLSLEQYSCYIGAHRIILIIFAVISLFMLIPIMNIKEAAEDYNSEIDSKPVSETPSLDLTNKYAVLFLVYIILTRFSGSLIVPQLSIYLTNLGINRVTVSILGTIQFFAILIFTAFLAKAVRKFGQVYTIVALYMASVPFMLILANGYSYGNKVELIVGAALFFRAGLANAATPALNALTMELVAKKNRSLYSSIIFAIQSLSQILAGLFAKFYLLKNDSGYANAYYYGAVLYIIAHAILLAFFTNKYNQQHKVECTS